MVALLVGLGMCSAHTAWAHDFWVEPAAFVMNEPTAVRLKVGSKKDVKTVARMPDRIIRLEGLTADGALPIVGRDNADPVGVLTPNGEADVILVYESNYSYIELEPEAFERYLAHEGLQAISKRRLATGQSKKAGLESYARNCKALVTVGKPDGAWKRVLGLPLEFVPVADPRRAKEELQFTLLFHGKPLAGARVDLMPLDDLEKETAATTDAKGLVRFSAPSAGQYMVATTHMFDAKPPVKGDWASLWATFAFEVREPAQRP